MTSSLVVLRWFSIGFVIATAAAFRTHIFLVPLPERASSRISLRYGIDIAESTPRDIAPLSEWAGSCGVQTVNGFQLSTDDGLDVFAITNQDLPADSPVLYVPNMLTMTGSKAREEFGAGSSAAEQILTNSNESEYLPQFYLFLKVLKEYELGMESPWYPWLNSLPRYYSNGASMTEFCFGCLPPYAAKQSLAEKRRLNQFVEALSQVAYISDNAKFNTELTRWAYSVVQTRSLEIPERGDFCLAPMADYFNHGGTEANVYISYDGEGSCYAYSICDVPAGQALKICYGNPSNPSKLLAKYGFLDESSSATFCKYIIDNPSEELFNLGYPSGMHFYRTGEIAMQVWDVLLYQELGKANPEEQRAFYQAHMTGDGTTKQRLHEQYYPRTLAVLQNHVEDLLNEVEELGFGIEAQIDQGQDAERHPRLPLLMRHNDFVKETLELVQKNLDKMMVF